MSKGFGPAAAGVVDQDVDLAEGGQRRVDQRLPGGIAGDIAGHAHRAAAGGHDGLGHRIGGLLLQVADHHRRAGLREQLGDAAADAGAAAGDDRHLALQAECCPELS